MYSAILFTHSWFRWILLILMLVLLIKSFKGFKLNSVYTRKDNLLRVITTGLFDLQVLIGASLYFFESPIVKAALDPESNFMKDSQLRFFVVEHVFGMVVALIVLHVGGVMVKKADNDARKFKLTAITVLVTLLIVLISIPWPGLPYGRILFRGL